MQKKLRYAKSDGFPVGVVEDLNFRKQLVNRNLKINVNDLIVQNTDGVNEAMNNKKEFFGDRRFYNAIIKYENLHSQEFIKLIRKDVLEFTLNAPQNDDITLIGVKMIS